MVITANRSTDDLVQAYTRASNGIKFAEVEISESVQEHIVDQVKQCKAADVFH